MSLLKAFGTITTRAATHLTRGTGSRTQLGQQIRVISGTPLRHEIFNVQSVDEFESKVKKSDKLVIVDFFATWCNPCKLLTPRIESIIDEKAGSIKLAKVDIDEHTDLALDYEVSAVPVLMIMKNGKEVSRMVGVQDKDKLKAWIDNAVDKA